MSLPTPALHIFAARERALLDNAARRLPAPPGARLELLDREGMRLWSGGAGAEPESASPSAGQVLCEIELDFEDLKWGSLRLRSGSDETEAASDEARDALQTIGELLESCLRRETELQGFVDEHIATTNQLIAIYNVTRKTRKQWDLDDRLHAIVEETVRVTGAASGFLSLHETEGSRLLSVPSDSEVRRLGLALLAEAEKLEKGHIRELDASLMPGAGSGRWCYVAAPFVADEESHGWILLTTSEGQFTAGDQKLLDSLADLAGGFVQTTHLQDRLLDSIKIQREMEIAESIQRLLVPSRFDHAEAGEDGPGVDVAAGCHPASQVGGDFYLVKPGRDGSILCALGDVTGKGVSAGLLMSMTRTGVLALNRVESNPARILRELNHFLLPELERAGKFVTTLVARYFPEWGRIDFANAGHSPVLRVTRDEGVVEIPPEANPIGIFDDLEVSTCSFILEPGEVFCVMTDGFTDACSPEGERFGDQGLRRVLEETRSRPAREILDRLVEAVRIHSAGAPQTDDQTIVVLKREESK